MYGSFKATSTSLAKVFDFNVVTFCILQCQVILLLLQCLQLKGKLRVMGKLGEGQVGGIPVTCWLHAEPDIPSECFQVPSPRLLGKDWVWWGLGGYMR